MSDFMQLHSDVIDITHLQCQFTRFSMKVSHWSEGLVFIIVPNTQKHNCFIIISMTVGGLNARLSSRQSEALITWTAQHLYVIKWPVVAHDWLHAAQNKEWIRWKTQKKQYFSYFHNPWLFKHAAETWLISGYMQLRFVNEIGVNTFNFGCWFPQVQVFLFITVINIYNDYYLTKNFLSVGNSLEAPRQSCSGSSQFLYTVRDSQSCWEKGFAIVTLFLTKNSSEKHWFRVIEHKINRKKNLDKKFNVSRTCRAENCLWMVVC